MKKHDLSLLGRLWAIPAHASITRLLSRRAFENAHVDRILVVRLDGIGDLVLTEPFLAALRETHPKAHIVLVTRPTTRAFAETLLPVDDVLCFDPGTSLLKRNGITRQFAARAVVGEIRRTFGPVDLALIPRRGLDAWHATQLAALVGPRRLVGFKESHTGVIQVFQDSESLLDLAVSVEPELHESIQPLRLIEALGHTVEPRDPRIEIPARDLDQAEAIWSSISGDRKRVVLIAGTAHSYKRWPTERFERVLEEARAQMPLTCIALGTLQESAITPRSTGSVQIHDHCGQYSLLESTALIARADVVLTNDTGPMHIAAALQRPIVAIWCHPSGADPDHARAPEGFVPASDTAHLVRPSSPTPGCEAGCRAKQPCCILRVEVADVLEHFLLALA